MAGLPAGTVTFLFTDIEGSTRLLRRFGGKYAAILANHRRLLRAAFTAHSGSEVDIQGDAFFVAFARASDAVVAAVEGQQTLRRFPWPDGFAVRVRMGLHTGQPQLEDGGYIGLDVHRAARIAAAAHGGQILLSQATAVLVQDGLAPGLGLRILGEHHLKDFDHPEPLYQLLVDGLPIDFPPLRAEAETAVRSATVDNPLYRRTFVGRDQELHQLQAAFDGALSGRGSLVMLMGEPGIGKTTLSEQLTTYAAMRGGKTLVGHCYEEASLSLPYLPFVEAMRSHVLTREPEGLRHELGSGAGDIARVVPEVRERLHVEPSAGSGDPEEERYRLLQAVSGFLRSAATVQPLLVVLEDLHDADRGTLDLLLHVSHNLAGARLLIVGTYRDIEVDRAHPLSAALAELRRASSFDRARLRGLTADEVQRMLSNLSGQRVSWGLAEAVHRQTEGNPLFIQEVLRHLVEEGLLEREGGRWRPKSSERPLELGIPEGLRDVIGRRLAKLSAECNRILAVAAVIGRQFELGTLQAVAGIAEEELASVLEEAVRVAVLQESESRGRVGAVHYRFAHAFYRQTLYKELIAPRRLRLHQEVARALEQQYASRLEEHAVELAEHFAQSTDPGDLVKAEHYGELAAQRAIDVYAYGEAVRHLERCLQVQEVLDPADRLKRCELLLALGEALNEAGEPRRTLDAVAPEAHALAEGLDDRRRAARACYIAHEAIYAEGTMAGFGSPEAAAWAERAGRSAASETTEQVWAGILGGLVRFRSGEQRESVSLLAGALVLARRLGDPEALWDAGRAWLYCLGATRHGEERRRLAQEMEGWPRAGMRARTLGFTLYQQGCALLEQGERARAEQVWQEHAALAERTGQASLRLQTVLIGGLVATLDGGLEEALASGEEITRLGEELGLPVYAATAKSTASGRAMLYLGRAAELPEMTYRLVEPLRLAHSGQAEEARKLLDEFVLQHPEAGSPEDEMPVAFACPLLEAAVLVPHLEAARLLVQYLDGNSWSTSSHNLPSCPARHLGAASALLGDREAARTYYELALEAAGKIGFRPEIALTHLGIAELLLDEAINHQPSAISSSDATPSGEADRLTADKLTADSVRAEALAHLDFAIGELREMKMQPALEQALRHKELLKA